MLLNMYKGDKIQSKTNMYDQFFERAQHVAINVTMGRDCVLSTYKNLALVWTWMGAWAL